ncbi:hypothetical protein [Emcibacter sp.]|uniref:hypothetical protein n=1 Tax=Emcibacter sp. TaxID=1979954 RepID=UPI002AA6D728|nr:hypothetical protein [Emcibacter sp.]
MARKFLVKPLLAGLAVVAFFQFTQAQYSQAQTERNLPAEEVSGQNVPVDVTTEGQGQVPDDDFLPADEPPKSILFPDTEPGPYFPANTAGAGELPVPLDSGSRTGGAEIITSDVPGLDGEVQVAELGEEDPASFGLMTEAGDGFPRSMWRGSDLDRIVLMMTALPAGSKSPVMQALTERLLLTAAQVPVRTSQNSYSGATPDRSFLNARITKIRETGDLKQLSSFFQILPEGTLNPDREVSDILLLAGDFSAACRMTRQAIDDINQSSERTYWLKILAYCRALEGNAEGAGLALELLQESGSPDFAFFDLINKLLAGAGAAGDIVPYGYGSLDPLTYSLLTTLGQPAAVELLAQSSPLVLYAVAGNSNLSKEVRLEAAAHAYDRGWFPLKTLRAIYNLQEFSDSELQSAETLAAVDETVLADVLLYQAAAKEADIQRKAGLLKTIWDRALEKNDLARAALLNEQTVRTLVPSQELVQHTHHIVRALLLAGDHDQAKSWYEFVRGQAFAGSADATKALVDIWPLLLVTDDDGSLPWSMDILDLWWNGQMVLSRTERDNKAALLFSLTEALGHRVPEQMWQQAGPGMLEAELYTIQPSVWRSLIQAAREDRFGEGALLSLVALGPEGPSALDGTGLSTVVRALRTFGLEDEARNVALEALASRGF